MMILSRTFVALAAISAVACGGPSPTGAEPTSGRESPTEKTAPGEPAHADEEPTPTNAHALPEDASEALHQAEWLREEQVRLERALEIHLGRDDIACASAVDARDEVCLVADRVCALVEEDEAVQSRCDEARENCTGARSSVSKAGCRG